MASRVITELVELGDLDELVRHVDRLCSSEAWDELVELRDLCRAALERGRQLWPASARAEYLLALEAPPRWSARMLVPGAGRFALGPLAEVAASTHTWAELAPFAPPGPVASVAAHERVVRGEDVTGDERVDSAVLELPLSLASWEPAYPVAVYAADEASFPLPMIRGWEEVDPPAPRLEEDAPEDDEAVRALVELATAWTTESNGRAEAVVTQGSALDALSRLCPTSARVARIDLPEAMSRMAWTGASGGAHGHRRGMATGRFGAWWTLAAMTDLLDKWPPSAVQLGNAAARLRFYAWDAGGPDTGWVLRLAIEDPSTDRAWAVNAVDAG